jgi:plasmid stabilization system protein ParE
MAKGVMAAGVQYSQALIQRLEGSLRAASNQPYLRLTRPRILGGRFDVELENGPLLAYPDGRSEQRVVEILTADRRQTTFHLGFVAEFAQSPARKYSLQHASVSVFYDILGSLMPLFRAEWDQLDASNKTSKHAQPHWHFVQRPERIEGIVRAALTRAPSGAVEFASEQDGELFVGLIDCGKLHFAMSSLGERASIKKEFDSEEFSKWFESLMRYIADQIAYLISRVPDAATPAARVFRPAGD